MNLYKQAIAGYLGPDPVFSGYKVPEFSKTVCNKRNVMNDHPVDSFEHKFGGRGGGELYCGTLAS